MFFPQTHAAQTRRESSLRVFSQDVQIDSFGSGFQKTRIGRLEKTWSPILLIKKQGEDPRDLGYSDKSKLSYNASNVRCPDPPGIEPAGFSQDVQFGLFGRQKTQIGRLEKTWSPILLIKKQGEDPRDLGYSDKWKLSYNASIKRTLPRPAGNRACGFFLKTSKLIVLGFKKLKLDALRNLKPHPLNQKTRRRSERSGLFRQIKAIIQRFNQTYAAQTRRESSLRVFSQDVQIYSFGLQKTQIGRLEKLEAPSS